MILFAGFLFWKPAFSQSIPIEIFAGDNKATLDIMFFKYFGQCKVERLKRHLANTLSPTLRGSNGVHAWTKHVIEQRTLKAAGIGLEEKACVIYIS